MIKLLSKNCNIPISKFSEIKNNYKGLFKTPNNACFYDEVKLESKTPIDIFTFKNKKNEIIKKITVEGKKVIEQTFIPIKKSQVFIGEFLPVVARKISTIVKNDGNYEEKSEIIQAVTHRKNDKPIVSISRIDTYPSPWKNTEIEFQSLYQYENGKKPKGYQVYNYIRDWRGIDDCNAKYQFDGIDSNIQEFLINDPYFLLHLYSFKNFKKTAPNRASRITDVPSLEVKWYKTKNRVDMGFFNGTVNLNERANINRFQVIKNSAHEREHKWQLSQAERLKKLMENPEFSQKMYELELKTGYRYVDSLQDALIYIKEFDNYIKPEDNYPEYLNQTIEIKAREAQYKAEKDYKKSASLIKRQFPYTPDFMLGYSDKDCEKDIGQYYL